MVCGRFSVVEATGRVTGGLEATEAAVDCTEVADDTAAVDDTTVAGVTVVADVIVTADDIAVTDVTAVADVTAEVDHTAVLDAVVTTPGVSGAAKFPTAVLIVGVITMVFDAVYVDVATALTADVVLIAKLVTKFVLGEALKLDVTTSSAVALTWFSVAVVAVWSKHTALPVFCSDGGD